MEFCKASDYYREFRWKVVYSDPTQSQEDVLEILQRWLKKKGWPLQGAINSEDLTSLIRWMHCVHVPYLFAQATLSFGWSATVQIQRTGTSYHSVYNPSTGRNESKPHTYTYYDDEKRSGVVVDRDVFEWIVDMHGEMKCGAPDFGKAELLHGLKRAGGPASESDIVIISPLTRTEEQVERRFQDVLESGIRRVVIAEAAPTSRSVIGRLFDPNTTVKSESIKITGIEGDGEEWVNLYPVWLSYYTYKDKVYAVEVDAHTGQVHVEEPFSVRMMRYGAGALGCGLMLFIALLALLLVAYLSDPSGFSP